MTNIPVVDVNIAQEEINAVTAVLKSKFLVEGKNARAFEEKFKKYTGSKFAATVTNGTCALHMALTALNIGPGDEVITTPFTFVASSNSILFNGAIPIFVDVKSDTFNMDPKRIEEAITPKTKAIMPVHIFGNPCDMKAIKDIAEDHNLFIIEDCAQAHDARIDGQHTGTFGDIGCFSFYGTKNLVGGEGGALICQNEELFAKIQSLKNHGRSPAGGYSHLTIGYNYRTTDMSAAIMNIQMDRADEILQRRHRNGELYRQLLADHPNLIVQKILPDAQSSDYIMAPVLKSTKKTPQDVIEYLRSKNISSRTIYSLLSYEQPCYQNIADWIMARVVKYPDYSKCKCPNAEYIAKNHFEIPMVSTLSDENIHFIVDALKDFFK